MTAWRWRNRLRRVRARLLNWCVPWAAEENDRQTPCRKLFLVGAPRSGTTWVNTIFAHHPLVLTTATESRLYPEVMDPLREHGVRGTRAWAEILKSYQSHRHEVLGIHRYVNERTFRGILDGARQQVDTIREWTNDDAANYVIRRVIDRFFWEYGGTQKHLFVEKTPIHVLYGPEILRTFPEAKVLHVLRDGRDVCASLQVRANEAEWAPRWRLRQIRIWKQCAEAGMDLLDNLEFQGRTALVRYEDIKRDPVTEISRLFAFAGLPASPHLVSRIAQQTDFRRHRKKGPGKHNNKGVVGGWREHFSEEDEQLFAETAGELTLRCGYRLDDTAHAA